MGDIKSTLMTGGGCAAIFAGIMAGWKYIQEIFHYIIGIFIGTSILKEDAGSAAMAYAFSKAIKSPLGQRIFGGHECYVHPKRWSETVVYEGLTSDPVLIKYGRQYALVSLVGSQGRSAADIGEVNIYGNLLMIRYFRWFFNIEQFIIDAADFYNTEKRQRNGDNNMKKKRRSRFKITRCSSKYTVHENEKVPPGTESGPATIRDEGWIEQMIITGAFKLLKWQREDLQMKPEDGQSPFTGYPFPDKIGEAIQELQCWLSNEKWFRSKSIPWRRGWVLAGKPGSGKSTLTRALAMTFDMPIYIFDLSSMTNNEFVGGWESMMSNTPCIALIEDIDAVFNKREYVGSLTQGVPHLTYDCLLNCISGVKQADGVFLIVTTNFIEKIDDALGVPQEGEKSTRPGRIDKVIQLGNMEEPQRRCLANHILSDYPQFIEETIGLGEGETAAQFQSRCAQIALNQFWKDERFKSKTIEIMHFDSTPKAEPTRDGELANVSQVPWTGKI